MTFKRFAVAAMATALALPSFAGDEAKGKDKKAYRCEVSTQACLDMMAAKLQGRGWVGIEWEPEDRSITKVVPGSPAEQAGLRAGDLIVAQDGIAFAEENWEKLDAARRQFVPGKVVSYTVERNGETQELAVTLGELPREVLAIWVGNHMLEHATQVASK